MPAKARTQLPSRGDLVLATDQPELAYLDLADIRRDGGTQMRAELNPDTVADYVAVMQEHAGWGPFPPITVFYDGSTYWLADGFHRVSALNTVVKSPATPVIEDSRIPAKVIPGDRRAAILHAVAANANHGLRRTNADKRRSVETLLRDDEWRQWSDTEIARRCMVDPKTVGTLRKELARTMEIPESAERKTADGRTMNTANIGTVVHEYALREPIQKWVVEQTSVRQEQAALLAALAAQQKEHPDWTAMIAALPPAAKTKQIVAALGLAHARIQESIAAHTYTVHQLPSGSWYARNQVPWFEATAPFETEEEAYAAAYAKRWESGRRHEIEFLANVLTDFEENGWKHLNHYDSRIKSTDGWLLNELRLGLEQAVAKDPDHAELQRRLGVVQARIVDLEATLNLVRPQPPARAVYTGSPPAAEPPTLVSLAKASASGLPLPGLDAQDYVKSRRQNLHHLAALYREVLDTLEDYEKLTGIFGHGRNARMAIRPMLEMVERNLGLVPTEQEKI
jgi:hypothetical protein